MKQTVACQALKHHQSRQGCGKTERIIAALLLTLRCFVCIWLWQGVQVRLVCSYTTYTGQQFPVEYRQHGRDWSVKLSDGSRCQTSGNTSMMMLLMFVRGSKGLT